MDRRKIGSIGEDVSCEYLEKNGFRILERNFLTRHGEIDIIAENDRYIVFTEVKLRTLGENTARFGRPALAVTKSKMKNIIMLENFWKLFSHHLKERKKIDKVALILKLMNTILQNNKFNRCS